MGSVGKDSEACVLFLDEYTRPVLIILDVHSLFSFSFSATVNWRVTFRFYVLVGTNNGEYGVGLWFSDF